MKKRLLSLLLSFLLALCGCGPAKRVARAYLRAGYALGQLHGQTAFVDMVLSYPDPEEIRSSLDRALETIGTATGPAEHAAILEKQTKAYNELVSAASLAYVRYCQNVDDVQRATEYGRLNTALYAIQHRLAKLEKELMDRWGYRRGRGAAYADAIDRLSRQDDDLRSLRAQEDALCRRYEHLGSEYRLQHGGRAWTMEELMADEDLSLQAFLETLELYQIGRNQAAGDIFTELIALRKRMAQSSGYTSYAASQYAAFGRGYTPEQASHAAKIVKQVFVPLYARLRERCENDLRYLSGAVFREDQFLSVMAQAADRVLPGAGEAWRYMLSYGLYDSQPSKHKLQGSFTTYFAAYRCPFLFTQWTEDASSVFTVIHEFGHFLSYYMNPEGTYYGTENLDLAETDAQGFELLMLKEYDALFGRYAASARLCFLTNALYAILTGFMEDEFQQRAYALDDPSVDALNRLYGELAAEYGFDKLFGYEGREWTEISHTFQFPFYYVSYGVSMLAAVRLNQGGSNAYEHVLRRRAGMTLTEAIGEDVLEEESIRRAATWFERMADEWLQE